MAYDKQRVNLIFELLKQTTSISVVSEYLRYKSLPHSAGSWEDLIEKRLRPAIEDNRLSEADMTVLLREVEEHGRQHVFLFRCEKKIAKELLDPARLEQVARQKKLFGLLKSPAILDQPKVPTITDIRLNGSPQISLTIKEIEQRKKKVLQNEEYKNGLTTITYIDENKRAVNLARLRSNGILEIRVSSHDSNSRSRYEQDVKRLRTALDDFFPVAQFNEVSLEKAKQHIYLNHENLAKKIRWANITWQADDGTKITGSATPETHLFQSQAMNQSVNTYASFPGHCDGSNLHFLPSSGGLSRERHVLLSGALNEFAITVNCSEADYEYILDAILSYNV